MKKNLSTDAKALTKILENQKKIKGVIKDFNCDFSQTNRGLLNNVYAFDLCALYMAQIGECVSLLTDDTKKELEKVLPLDVLKYFRNMIDHVYEKVNKTYLQAYIQQVITQQAFNSVIERYKYCIKNKKS